jgi:toxin CptA
MGCGSLLVPGGNDGLLLTGLPLLQPYALVALASMAAAIICGMEVERRIKTW